MNRQLTAFIETSFGSVWTLETLLVLMERPRRDWTKCGLVAHLRSNEAIVAAALDRLATSGLARENADGQARYAPATAELDALAASVEAEYARAPAAVRRMIMQTQPPVTGG
jgi:hypothetical protein